MPALMLANYWKPIAIAVAIAAALAYRGILIHQRDAARVETASMTAQVADLKSAEAACEDAAARESAAAETRQANVAAAAAAAASEEARRAAAIQSAPIASDCAGAIRWA